MGVNRENTKRGIKDGNGNSNGSYFNHGNGSNNDGLHWIKK